MAAQRQDLAVRSFNFVPTTLKEAQEYATIFASSGLCPESYRGRPNDILIVWQMGKELGLEKMQALRTLGCINGMPFAYGDGKLALVKRHPEFEDMKEWFEGELANKTLRAFCTMKRRGQEPITQSFGIDDAMLAGLWNKKGVWQMYPRRMLQHRARGFAANDAFPDACFGLMSEDEARGVVESTPVVEAAPIKGKGMAGLEESLGLAEDTVIEGEIVDQAEVNICESIHDRFLNELAIHKVPEKSKQKWCKQFNVETIEAIPDEGKQKIIDHLTQPKESK